MHKIYNLINNNIKNTAIFFSQIKKKKKSEQSRAVLLTCTTFDLILAQLAPQKCSLKDKHIAREQDREKIKPVTCFSSTAETFM